MEDFDAVIFDRDGVLLNWRSYDWIIKAKIEKASELGVDLTQGEAEEKIFCDSIEEMEKFLQEKGMDWNDLEKISRSVTEKQKEKMKSRELDLFSGVREVLNGLDVPVGLVSNASLESTEFFVGEFGLEDCFDCIVAPPLDEPERRMKMRKPHPVMLEEAIKCLDAENPIFLGDSNKDLRAAEEAGVEFVLVEGDVPKLLKEFGA